MPTIKEKEYVIPVSVANLTISEKEVVDFTPEEVFKELIVDSATQEFLKNIVKVTGKDISNDFEEVDKKTLKSIKGV